MDSLRCLHLLREKAVIVRQKRISWLPGSGIDGSLYSGRPGAMRVNAGNSPNVVAVCPTAASANYRPTVVCVQTLPSRDIGTPRLVSARESA